MMKMELPGRKKDEDVQRVSMTEEDAGIEADGPLWRPLKGAPKRKRTKTQESV